MTLHLTYDPNTTIRDRLDRWDNAVRRGPELADGNWRLLIVWPAARYASVSSSTGIEGNPLDADQVEAVLAGTAIHADRAHIREIENYNRALNLARDSVRRSDFEWTHQIVHDLNATVMDDLPRDTHGNYRVAGDEVQVGIFTGPSPLVVPTLMNELMDWLRRPGREPVLIRSALLHLNIIAVHPFNDGNGRIARILASMILMQDGIRAPELISVEAYLRRNRDEYVDALRTTLGMSYDPDNHPVTDWLDYYTRVSLDRLQARDRILDALPTDIGILHAALADAGHPLDWAPALLASRVGRLRTAQLADLTNRSAPAARAELGRMSHAGWLEPRGATRGRWYAPTGRLAELQIRVPDLMRRLAIGDELASFDR